MSALSHMQGSLQELIAKNGTQFSAVIVSDDVRIAMAAVALSLQPLDIEPAEIYRVPKIDNLTDALEAAKAIKVHPGPVIIEMTKGMNADVLNLLLDESCLRRRERLVFIICVTDDATSPEPFIGLLSRVGYTIVREASIN